MGGGRNSNGAFQCLQACLVLCKLRLQILHSSRAGVRSIASVRGGSSSRVLALKRASLPCHSTSLTGASSTHGVLAIIAALFSGPTLPTGASSTPDFVVGVVHGGRDRRSMASYFGLKAGLSPIRVEANVVHNLLAIGTTTFPNLD